jgi:ABC-type antimicrobial peptide transport system permease subunit
VTRAEPLSDALAGTIRERRFSAWLFTSFGAGALVIAGAGILGLLAMATSERTREVGIRMALGATRTVVIRQLLTEQASGVALGLAMGGVLAAWAVRFVDSYLYKMSTYEASAWAAALAAVLAVSLIGGLIPSVWASRVDPVKALRVE